MRKEFSQAQPEPPEKLQEVPIVSYFVDITDAAALNQFIAKVTRLSTNDQKKLLSISYGSKTLSLFLRQPGSFFGSYVYADTSIEKKLGETTRCYQELYVLLCKIANTLQKPIRYTVVTENINMMNWILNEGQRIFSWKTI